VRKEGTSNIAFELIDGVDFLNHLSLLCNCVMICKCKFSCDFVGTQLDGLLDFKINWLPWQRH